MNNYIMIISTSTLIFTVVLIVYQFIRAISIDNNFKKVNMDIQNINKDISTLQEISKNAQFTKGLNLKIDVLVENIYNVKPVSNFEFKFLLSRGIDKSKYVFSRLIDKDFKFNKDDLITLKTNIYLIFKSLKSNTNFKNFDFKEDATNLFINDIETIMLSHLDTFVLDYQKISSELTNGIRRAAYEKICLKMVENIMRDAIDLFNKIEYEKFR